MSDGLTVIALPSPHRFRPGDDLARHVLTALADAGRTLEAGDVVCVASKVVSLCEGAQVRLPDAAAQDPRHARRELAREQATAVVAESPGVLVVRTRHGFVAANAGIDASNVDAGHALLLPADPDASASRLRAELAALTGTEVGVLVTDTFGRPWRLGQTDVALGVAGIPAVRDERGGLDLLGRELDVTQAAVADELAGAADLVRTKGSGTPFVLIRGWSPTGQVGTGADLVRPLEEDLFRTGGATTASAAIAARRTVRHFDPHRPVPEAALHAAVAAAATAPAPHHSRPWRFVRPAPDTRERLLTAMAERWREDLAGDGLDPAAIDARIGRSDALLRTAPELLIPFVARDDAHAYPDARRARAERDLFVLSGGAALQNLQVVLTGHGIGAAWISATVFCPEVARAVLDLPATWEALGVVAIGWPDGPPPSPRPAPDLATLVIER